MLPRTFLTQLIPARIAEAARHLQVQIWMPLPAAVIEVAQTDSFRHPNKRRRKIKNLPAEQLRPRWSAEMPESERAILANLAPE